VRAIYDALDGRPTPDAIRAFIEAAYANWSPRPTYVLLVGDGTFDPRRYRPASSQTFIPPFLADVDPWMGETAADNRYAAVDGSDSVPDVAIGRLPVNTLAEAQAVVSKLVLYETAPPTGNWNNRLVMVADDADGAGNFAAQAESLAGLAASHTIARAYFTGTTALTDTRAAILAEWNAGASAVVYTGHATMRQWAAERLFHMDDAGTVSNGGRLPVLVELTCFAGSFHDAGLATLDESLLRRAGGGVVGAWGPTGLGVATGHDLLGRAFLKRVYQDGLPDVGAAALAGKLALAAAGQDLDLIDTYGWLGDPATTVQLVVNPGESLFLPLIRR
jgi:hypothetical protein